MLITMEGLARLQWYSFCKWLEEECEPIEEANVDTDTLKEAISKCRMTITHEDKGASHDAILDLSFHTRRIKLLLDRFTEGSSEKSLTFVFWNEYKEMVEILLLFIRAEREGLWEFNCIWHL